MLCDVKPEGEYTLLRKPNVGLTPITRINTRLTIRYCLGDKTHWGNNNRFGDRYCLGDKTHLGITPLRATPLRGLTPVKVSIPFRSNRLIPRQPLLFSSYCYTYDCFYVYFSFYPTAHNAKFSGEGDRRALASRLPESAATFVRLLKNVLKAKKTNKACCQRKQ